jgi:hypothetical protein
MHKIAGDANRFNAGLIRRQVKDLRVERSRSPGPRAPAERRVPDRREDTGKNALPGRSGAAAASPSHCYRYRQMGEFPKRPNRELNRSNREPNPPNREAPGIAACALHAGRCGARGRRINPRGPAAETPAPGFSAAPHTLELRRRPPRRAKVAAPRHSPRCAGRRDGTTAPLAANGRDR